MTLLDHRLYLAHGYAVIDPLLVPADLWCDAPRLPLAPVGLTRQQERLAQLLCLRHMAEGPRLKLLQRASSWEHTERSVFFSALIQADVAPARLQMHLRNLQTVTGPQGQQALFRSYAPEVFSHLSTTLQSGQLRQWFGPISAWTWRHFDATWQTCPCPDTPGDVSRLLLTANQWHRLARVGVVNRLLQRARGSNPLLKMHDALLIEADRCVELAYECLANRMTAGHAANSIDEACVLLLASQCLDHGRAIAEHPVIAARLQRFHTHNASFVSVCADLDFSSLGAPRAPVENA